jgi:hypothetical protein
MRDLFRRLRHALKRDRFEADLAEELEFHRAMNSATSRTLASRTREAGYAARRSLGNVELAQERARDSPGSRRGSATPGRTSLRRSAR